MSRPSQTQALLARADVGADAPAIQDLAVRIRAGLQRSGADIVAVGTDLLGAKELLGHGRFGAWLEQEFGLSQRSAERFMAAARRFGGKSDIVSNLPPGVIHELAAPGTPDEIVERVITGEIPATVKAVRTARQSRHRQRAHHRAVRGLLDELWDLPDETEEAAGVIAQQVLDEDPEFAWWIAQTLYVAAELIAKETSDET